jgi:hypothetical protein
VHPIIPIEHCEIPFSFSERRPGQFLENTRKSSEAGRGACRNRRQRPSCAGGSRSSDVATDALRARRPGDAELSDGRDAEQRVAIGPQHAAPQAGGAAGHGALRSQSTAGLADAGGHTSPRADAHHLARDRAARPHRRRRERSQRRLPLGRDPLALFVHRSAVLAALPGQVSEGAALARRAEDRRDDRTHPCRHAGGRHRCHPARSR